MVGKNTGNSSIHNGRDQGASRRQRHGFGRLGFTLAEMLVTVLIIVILAAFGFVAVIQYQRNLKVLEDDGIAEEIFMAAQNHLIASQASGEWKAYYEENKNKNTVNSALGAKISQKPGDMSDEEWNLDWKLGTDNKTASGQDAKHDFRYLLVNNIGDGSSYGADALNGTSALQYILPYGATDESVRSGGSYVIEYDALSGAIYGVFYTDGTRGSFGGNNPTGLSASVYPVTVDAGRPTSKDDSEAKKARRVGFGSAVYGYYGGATADGFENGGIVAPILSVRNAENLILTIVDPNYGTYTENDNGSQKPGYKTYLTLTVTGNTSGASVTKYLAPVSVPANSFQSNLKNAVKNGTIANELGSGNHSSYSSYPASENFDYTWKSETANISLKVGSSTRTYTGARVYYVSLDSDTIWMGHFCNIYTTGDNKASDGSALTFIPGEDITLTVKATATANGGGAAEASVTTNSLFESVREVKNEKIDKNAENVSDKYTVVSVSNARHLLNLSNYISGIPDGRANTYKNANGETVSPVLPLKVSITRDIWWNDYAPDSASDLKTTISPEKSAGIESFVAASGKNTGDGSRKGARTGLANGPHKQIQVYLANGKADGAQTERKYVGIVNPNIQSFEGNNHVFGNFDMVDAINGSKGSENHSGLISDVNVSDGSSLAVRNVTLLNPRSISSICAGSLIGAVDSTNQKVTIDNCLTIATKGNSLYIEAPTKNETYAGGLIGFLSQPSSTNIVKVENCAVIGGGEKDQVVSGYAAGGLIGEVYGPQQASFVNCMASTYVSSTTTDRHSGAGGLIGVIDENDVKRNVTITGCYTGGRTSNGQYDSEDPDSKKKGRSNYADKGLGIKFAGGLIGEANRGADVTLKDCYSTASVYAESSSSSASAGSLVGGTGMGNSTIIIADCYTTGLAGAKGSSTTNTYCGFVGNSDRATVSFRGQCYYLRGVNDGNLKAAGDKNDSEVTGASEYFKTAYYGQENTPFAVDDSRRGDFKNCWYKDGLPNENISEQTKTAVYDETLATGSTAEKDDVLKNLYKSDYPFQSVTKITIPAHVVTLLKREAVPASVTSVSSGTASVQGQVSENGSTVPSTNSVTEEAETAEEYRHIGDWPIPKAESTLRIENSNTLTAIVGLPKSMVEAYTDSRNAKLGGQYISVAVRGNTSEQTEYLVLQIARKSGNGGKAVSGDSAADYIVSVVSEPNNAATPDTSWQNRTISGTVLTAYGTSDANGQSNALSIREALPATAPSDKTAVAHSGNPTSDSYSQGYYAYAYSGKDKDGNQVNSQTVTENPDFYYVEIALDDITRSGCNFASLFPDLTPGEDITVYAAGGLRTDNEMMEGTTGSNGQKVLTAAELTANKATTNGAVRETIEKQTVGTGADQKDAWYFYPNLGGNYAVTNSLFADGTNATAVAANSTATDGQYPDNAAYSTTTKDGNVTASDISSPLNDAELSMQNAVDGVYHLGTYQENTGVLTNAAVGDDGTVTKNATRVHVTTSGRFDYTGQSGAGVTATSNTQGFKGTAIIMTGRHLQNLSTEISGVDKTASASTALISKAEIRNDIVWRKNDGAALVDPSVTPFLDDTIRKSVYAANPVPASEAKKADGCFYSIKNNNLTMLRGEGGNSTFTTVDTAPAATETSARHVIANLSIQGAGIDALDGKTSGLAAGLLAQIYGENSRDHDHYFYLSGINLADPEIKADQTLSAAGFFVGQTYQWYKNYLYMADCSVIGTAGKETAVAGSSLKYAGGLIGMATGNDILTNVSLEADSIRVQSAGKGMQYAGGLIGGYYAENVTIVNGCVGRTDSNTSITTGVSGYAGGLIGGADGTSAAKTEVTIDRSSVIGKQLTVQSGSKETTGNSGAAGGFVGMLVTTNINNTTGGNRQTGLATISNSSIRIKAVSGSTAGSGQTGTTNETNGTMTISASGNCGNAGGIIGGFGTEWGSGNDQWRDYVGSLKVANTAVTSANGITITATGNAGGLVGHAGGTETSGNSINSNSPYIRIENNSVASKNIAVSGITAGGIAGELLASGTNAGEGIILKNDSAAATDELQIRASRRPVSQDIKPASTYAGYAGGAAGFIKGKSTIDKSYAFGGGNNDVVKGSNFAGGLIGRLDGNGQVVTVKNSAASVYVMAGGTDATHHKVGAGGLFGYIANARTGSSINNCYAGGRTTNSGKYLNATGYVVDAAGNISGEQGRFNVQIMDDTPAGTKAVDAIGNLYPVAGGFIGLMYKDNLVIDSCYTTASVYNPNGGYNNASNGDEIVGVGSFIGGVDNQKKEDPSTVTINSCYSTGIIGVDKTRADKAAVAGNVGFYGYIARSTNATFSGRDNYYLRGVQGVDASGKVTATLRRLRDVGLYGNTSTETGITASEGKFLQGVAIADGKTLINGTEVTNTPFSTNNSGGSYAAVYDTGLGVAEKNSGSSAVGIAGTHLYSAVFPYQSTAAQPELLTEGVLTARLDGTADGNSAAKYAHIGDWPKAVPIMDTKLRIVNGSKLSVLLAVPKDLTPYFEHGEEYQPVSFAVRGMTSSTRSTSASEKVNDYDKVAYMALQLKKGSDGNYTVSAVPIGDTQLNQNVRTSALWTSGKTSDTFANPNSYQNKTRTVVEYFYQNSTNTADNSTGLYGKEHTGVKGNLVTLQNLKGEFSNEELSGLALAGDLEDGSGGTPSAQVTSAANSKYQYIEIDLDDITTEGGNFASIYSDFIPGEDLQIYAEGDEIEWRDLAADALEETEKARKYNDLTARTNSLFADGTNKGTNAIDNQNKGQEEYNPIEYNALAEARANAASDPAYIGGAVTNPAEPLVPAFNESAKLSVKRLDGNGVLESRETNPTQYGSIAIVINGRHLQNLSTEISLVNENNDEDKETVENKYGRNYLIKRAVIRNDILWTNGGAEDQKGNWKHANASVFLTGERKNIYAAQAVEKVNSKKDDGCFYAIKNDQLRAIYGGGINSDNSGKNTVLENLKILPDGETKHGGLMSEVGREGEFIVSNLDLVSPAFAKDGGGNLKNAGFFIGNIDIADSDTNSIGRTLLYHCGIYGDQLTVNARRAGLAIGYAEYKNDKYCGAVYLNDVTCEAGEAAITGRDNDPGSHYAAGGLIGAAAADNLTIDGCHVAAEQTGSLPGTITVTGEMEAGGLVGRTLGQNLTIRNSYIDAANVLTVRAGTSQNGNNTEKDNGFAGGLVGRFQGMHGDTRTATITGEAGKSTVNAGVGVAIQGKRSAGGIIGCSETNSTENKMSLNLTNCTIATSGKGTNDSGVYVVGGGLLDYNGSSTDVRSDRMGFAGGLVGEVEGQLSISGSHVLSEKRVAVHARAKLKNVTAASDDQRNMAGGLVGGTDKAGENNYGKYSITNSSVNSAVIDIFAGVDDSISGSSIKGDEGATKYNHCALAGGAFGYLRSGKGTETAEFNNVSVAATSQLMVRSDQMAGGLIAEYLSLRPLSITNCQVIGGGDQDLIEGGNYVGGLAAYLSMNGNDQLTINNCLASVYVRKDGNLTPQAANDGGNNQKEYGYSGVGGFIGSVRNAGSGSKISNSYVGGRTTGGNYGTDSGTSAHGRYNVQWVNPQNHSAADNNNIAYGGAGGFIGVMEDSSGSIENCYTTASVYTQTEGETADAGKVTGSFIGHVFKDKSSADVTISDCYSTGLISTAVESLQKDEKNTAGFIGKNEGNLAGANNYYLLGVNGRELVPVGTGEGYPFEELESDEAKNVNAFVKGASKGKEPFVASNSGTSNNSAAKPYDNISESYPFRTVTDYKSAGHIGDWPDKVQEVTEDKPVLPEAKDGDVFYSGEQAWVKATYKQQGSTRFYYTVDGSDPSVSSTRKEQWNGFNVTPDILDHLDSDDEFTIRIIAWDDTAKMWSKEAVYHFYLVKPIYYVSVIYQDKVQPTNWVATVGTKFSDLTFTINYGGDQCNFAPGDGYQIYAVDKDGNEVLVDSDDVVEEGVTYRVKVHLIANLHNGFRAPRNDGDGVGFENKKVTETGNVKRYGHHQRELSFTADIDTTLNPNDPNNGKVIITSSNGNTVKKDGKLNLTATLNNVVSIADWTSENSDIATVVRAEDGKTAIVTGVAKGETTITATISRPDGSTVSGTFNISITDESGNASKSLREAMDETGTKLSNTTWPSSTPEAAKKDEWVDLTIKSSGLFLYNGSYYCVYKPISAKWGNIKNGPDGLFDYGILKLTGHVLNLSDFKENNDQAHTRYLDVPKGDVFVENGNIYVSINSTYHNLPSVSMDKWYLIPKNGAFDLLFGNQENVQVTKLEIQLQNKNIVVDEKVQATVQVTPENATNKSLKWKITSSKSDEDTQDPVITMDDDGNIIGKNPGTATVRVTAQDGSNVSDSIEIIVKRKSEETSEKIKSISISPENAEVQIGDEITIEATIEPKEMSDKKIVWSIEGAVSIVREEGNTIIVKGKEKGNANVTAKVEGEDANKAATCTINVNEKEQTSEPTDVKVSEIKLDKSSLSLTIGATTTITATVAPADANNKEIKWNSSDEKVAKVSSGTITAVSEGAVTITATAQDGSNVTASCDVTVSQSASSKASTSKEEEENAQ